LKAALLALLLLSAAAAGAQGVKAPATLNERVTMVKVGSGLFGASLETTLFRPDGDGPFPVVVINHGKAAGNPVFQERARYINASREFVRRGYLVALPMRLGFSKSTGSYTDNCNITSNGDGQAEWVEGVVRWLRAQPYVDKDRIVIAGQSHGGLTALAVGARNPEGVRGTINFAGGLRFSGSGCLWENALAQAFASYGARSKLPSLWFYGDNDSFFPPELWKELEQKYRAAGGNVRLVAFGRFRSDAHGMFSSSEGLPIWLPEVEQFLETIGMPSKPVVELGAGVRMPGTGFAKLVDGGAVPHLAADGRRGYEDFLHSPLPRAFAVGPTGAWGWASDGDEPMARALSGCQQYGPEPCRLYAIDDDVVWKGTVR
jgi:dienelactone hydrolase